MGANIAGDIGRGELSEAVIGYTNAENAKVGCVRVGGCFGARAGAVGQAKTHNKTRNHPTPRPARAQKTKTKPY